MRASGGGRLRLGRKTEDFKATEVPPTDAVPILRAYLKKWKWEVGAFFDGIGPDTHRRRSYSRSRPTIRSSNSTPDARLGPDAFAVNRALHATISCERTERSTPCPPRRP